MFDLKKGKVIAYGSCLSAFACLILGSMQYIQCKKNGFFYSEGFSVKCNYFYEHGLLFIGGVLMVFAVSIYSISARFHNDKDI